MRTRRGALLGFGNVVERGHLPAWRERGDIVLAAAADPSPARRELAAQLLPGVRVYEDALDLLGRETLDFVDIGAPPAQHAPLAIEAARRGVHVLCEKPLTVCVDDYRAMVLAARQANVALFTVHNWKHSDQFKRVSALLRGGAVGRVKRIRLQTVRNGQSVTVGQMWRAQAAQAGGGILVDHGWHAFYLLTGLAGERPLRVGARIERRRYTDADVEDTAECTVEFPSLVGEISLTWAGHERRTSWEIVGDAGSMELKEERLELRRGGAVEQIVFPESLSAGSHHPDWFAAVIDGFLREVDDPSVRGTNLAESECCLALLTSAYASGARGSTPGEVPATLLPAVGTSR